VSILGAALLVLIGFGRRRRRRGRGRTLRPVTLDT
jgi:hypothetical protein